jgi:hypothetical protein
MILANAQGKDVRAETRLTTSVIAVYAVYAGAGHFKQQQFRTGRSTLLNTNTLIHAIYSSNSCRTIGEKEYYFSTHSPSPATAC